MRLFMKRWLMQQEEKFMEKWRIGMTKRKKGKEKKEQRRGYVFFFKRFPENKTRKPKTSEECYFRS